MAVHTFPKLEDTSLFEYSGESNYEPYSGIVLDTDDNTFKTVSGMFRDKKDFYEKLTKRGYVVRKVFEKKVFDWIEENAKTTLEAYLMFSTAFSKWKGNNLLDQYYTKLLNDIPQLNREKVKGNPNTRGKEDIMADESVLTEDENLGSYALKITPLDAERNPILNGSEIFRKVPLNIKITPDLFNTKPDKLKSSIMVRILQDLVTREIENGESFGIGAQLYYKILPDRIQGQDFDGLTNPLWENAKYFKVEIGPDADDNYFNPSYSANLTKQQIGSLKTAGELNANTMTAGKQAEISTAMLNKNKADSKWLNSLNNMFDIKGYTNTVKDTPDTSYTAPLSLSGHIKNIENVPFNKLKDMINKGTSFEQPQDNELSAQTLARLKTGQNTLFNKQDNNYYPRYSLLAYHILKDPEFNNILMHPDTSLWKLPQLLRNQDKKDIIEIETDRKTYEALQNTISELQDTQNNHVKNAQKLVSDAKREQTSILNKYEVDLPEGDSRWSKLKERMINVIKDNDINTELNNQLSTDMQNQIATQAKTAGKQIGGAQAAAVNPAAKVADLTRQNNELFKTADAAKYAKAKDGKGTMADFMHTQIAQNQEKNKKTIDTEIIPELKRKLEILQNTLEKGNWSGIAKKRAEAKVNALKRAIVARENQSAELADKLAKKKKAESVEDKIPVVDDIMPGKHVNYNAVLGYANQPIDGVITNPGAIQTSGTYMSEEEQEQQRWGWAHFELNQELFDGTKLRPEVREALLRIAEKFKNVLGLGIEPVDVYFTGSSANFNYNDQSDIDLHLVYDFEEIGINAEILIKYFVAKKQVFNNDYEISIKGIPVEVGVENLNEPIVATGIYSVVKDSWLLEPEYAEQLLPQPDMKLYYKTVQDIEKAIESRDSKVIGAMWDKLYDIRKESLATEGEYGKGNAMFKKLRNLGYLDRLKNAYYSSASEELSIESLKEI